MNDRLKKMLDGLKPDEIQEVEQYIGSLEPSPDSETDEMGQRAEAKSVEGNAKTMLHSSYRGKA